MNGEGVGGLQPIAWCRPDGYADLAPPAHFDESAFLARGPWVHRLGRAVAGIAAERWACPEQSVAEHVAPRVDGCSREHGQQRAQIQADQNGHGHGQEGERGCLFRVATP